MTKFRIYFTVCFIICCATLTNCAKRGFISGGPLDTLPPVVLKSNPKNYSTHFDKQEILIDFDEFIKLKNVNQNLIISPPMENTPDISPMGNAKKTMTVKIKDTLKENTTYSFNFGDAIIDNNEGNPLKQFKYVFSTGSYIDSLTLSGTIKSAHQLKTDNFVNVMLYDAKTFQDSTVYRDKPLYITNTLDSLTTFTLENLKEGTYYLIAMKDKNNDYKFSPQQDKIAFIKDSITIPTEQQFELVLFKSDEKFEANRPSQISENKWYVPYIGNPEGAEITVRNNDSLIRNTYSYLQQKDSLQLWFPRITADSLLIDIKKDDFEKTFSVRPRAKMKLVDTLSVSGKGSSLDFISDFSISTTTPISKIQSEFIRILNKDSVEISFETENIVLEQKINFKFKKEEEESYQIQMLPGALIDFFDKQNDTLQYNLKTGNYTDYGNLTLNLSGIKRFPIIVELLDEQEKVISTRYSENQTKLEFTLLPPRKYLIRIIYDDNENGKWDTGYYWDKRQPEETFYFPEAIDVRANWDITQEVQLE